MPRPTVRSSPRTWYGAASATSRRTATMAASADRAIAVCTTETSPNSSRPVRAHLSLRRIAPAIVGEAEIVKLAVCLAK